jgi:hypothetical protein
MPTKFLAALAASSLAATPVAAARHEGARPSPVAATSHYGPYVSIGGGWGLGGYRGRHHRRGSTAGDILTGVLILGTIAAVANAAKKAGERRGYPNRYPHPDRPNDYRPNGPQGLDGAADLCLREVERDARAREVTGVERNAGGWLVTGSMADGAAFSCSIGADGRIERIEIDGRAQTLGSADEIRGDDRTARSDTGPQPAYPGGPLPGEESEEEAPES